VDVVVGFVLELLSACNEVTLFDNWASQDGLGLINGLNGLPFIF
jgi:hypothetical protein